MLVVIRGSQDTETNRSFSYIVPGNLLPRLYYTWIQILPLSSLTSASGCICQTLIISLLSQFFLHLTPFSVISTLSNWRQNLWSPIDVIHMLHQHFHRLPCLLCLDLYWTWIEFSAIWDRIPLGIFIQLLWRPLFSLKLLLTISFLVHSKENNDMEIKTT